MKRHTVVSYKEYERVCKELEHYKRMYQNIFKEYIKERKVK